MFVVLRFARQKPAFFRLPPVIGYLLHGIPPEFRMRSGVDARMLGGTQAIGPVVCHGDPDLPLAISIRERGKQKVNNRPSSLGPAWWLWNADPVSGDRIRFQHSFRFTDFAYQ